jgi:putative nucleotidyltransferase with HDIG domain
MSVEHVITLLASSRRAMQLYPPSHPAYQEAFDSLVAAASGATASGPLVLNLHNGRIYHESTVISDDVTGHAAVAEAFEVRHIESLTVAPGFSAADAAGLIEVLSLRPSPSLDVEAELASRGVRSITVALLADDDEDDEERDRQREADRALYNRLLAAMRDVSGRMASGGAPDIAHASGLVGNVLSRLMEDAPAIMGLATIRGAGDRALFHSLNVMIYSLVLGQKLGLPDEGLSSLGLAALLHDVGKAAFDADKPEQVEPMRVMHPKVGAEILQRLSLEDPAPMLVAYEHHMYVDGSGWPERDSGYVAHPYSRMVAIADRFENLTNPVDGAESLTPDRAVVQVLRDAGATLDPFFSRLFAGALGVFPVGCLVRLSDHSVGVVSRPGEDPLAPVVRRAFDDRGTELEDIEEIDLSAGDVRIVEVIHPDSLALDVAEKL